MIRRLDPEQEVLELIRDAKTNMPQLALSDLTAGQLFKEIYNSQVHLRTQLLTLAKGPVRLGQLLGRLVARKDKVVTSRTISGQNCYKITF